MLHEHGIKVVHVVSSVKFAIKSQEAGVDADVHIMLCRDRLVGLESVLGTNAIVIAGENKLASQLTKRGHQVLALDSPANAERES